MAVSSQVSPPLEIKIGPQNFSCSGTGLIKNGHGFCPYIQTFLPLLEPKKTKAGKIAVRQPDVPRRAQEWWKAQCVFRGLSQAGTIGDMQDRLRGNDDSMTDELQEVQLRLNAEYLKSNAAARDAKWLALESNEARAEKDPGRFLEEEFVDVADEASADKVIVLKTHARAQLHQAAERARLQHESANAPLKANGTRQSPDRWLVVGKSRSAVFAKISEIHRDAQRTQQRAKDAYHEQNQGLHQEVVSDLTGSERSGKWNITGSWSIQSRCFDYASPIGTEECTLDIYHSRSGRGHQIFAIFNFTNETGIMRFIHPKSSRNAANRGATGVKKDKYRNEEEEEGDEDEDENEESSDEFYMDDKSSPSHSNPTWKYRWRGEETGEGEIQLYSDEKLCSMTFSGAGGTKLEGIYYSGRCCNGCHITGLKISSDPSAGMPNPSEEWSSRNESAHEHARVARWR